jgi:hypothetical protein
MVRQWARGIRASHSETVFEGLLQAQQAMADHLARLAPTWFWFNSHRDGSIELLPAADILKYLSASAEARQMISLVDPGSGGGLTVDVSDEGHPLPTLQIAGWGLGAAIPLEIKNLSATLTRHIQE